jgi:hypothetical protein
VPAEIPSSAATWATQIGFSSGSRGRRVARIASSAGRKSVWTKSFEKAGWERSAAAGAIASSA